MDCYALGDAGSSQVVDGIGMKAKPENRREYLNERRQELLHNWVSPGKSLELMDKMRLVVVAYIQVQDVRPLVNKTLRHNTLRLMAGAVEIVKEFHEGCQGLRREEAFIGIYPIMITHYASLLGKMIA